MPLDKKYRPRSILQFYGNEHIIGQIKKFTSDYIPTCILLKGKTGCGKTTLSRIIASRLKYETIEINISDARGIDQARSIIEASKFNSLTSSGRAFILNEIQGANAHFLNAILDVTEEPQSRTIFILCTTEPNKLPDALLSRCYHMEVEPLDGIMSRKLISKVTSKESIMLSEEEIDMIVESSGGVPRIILLTLEAILNIKDRKDIPKVIDSFGYVDSNASAELIELCRALLAAASYREVTSLLRGIKDQPETIRRVVISYMSKVLINGKQSKQALLVLGTFASIDTSIGIAAIVYAIAAIYIN